MLCCLCFFPLISRYLIFLFPIHLEFFDRRLLTGRIFCRNIVHSQILYYRVRRNGYILPAALLICTEVSNIPEVFSIHRTPKHKPVLCIIFFKHQFHFRQLINILQFHLQPVTWLCKRDCTIFRYGKADWIAPIDLICIYFCDLYADLNGEFAVLGSRFKS